MRPLFVICLLVALAITTPAGAFGEPLAEHVVMAVMPSAQERKLLDMKASEPCLLLRRQTWSSSLPVTWALLLHPADRYRLGGRFTAAGRS